MRISYRLAESAFLCFFIVLFYSCSPYPRADYYEVDGILSIDLAAADETPNWHKIDYINSRGLVSHIQEPDSSYSLDVTFYLSNPGSYSFWVLTTANEDSDDDNGLDVTVTGPEGFLADQFQLTLPAEKNQLMWVSEKNNRGDKVMLDLRGSGYYTLRFNSRGRDGFQLHKIHMSFEDYVKPSGLGLPASNTPQINSSDLFREQPVMLPPDWMFGLIIGFGDESNLPSDTDNPFDEQSIRPDAIWSVNSSSDRFYTSLPGEDIITGIQIDIEELIREDNLLHEAHDIYKQGYHFLKIEGEVSPGQTKALASAQQNAFPDMERVHVLRGMEYAFEPVSRQYPAMMTGPAVPAWSSASEIGDDSFSPGGLKEVTRAFSKPQYSIYNIPYLSIPLGIDEIEQPDVAEPGELWIRKIQLATFMPVMHLIQNRNKLLSEHQQSTLQRYANLRLKLFPYIYTHAHITRQTGQSLIGGFRDYENQFRFGDAFLVAPITEPGMRQRSVYFPGEGSWYDFDTGRRYNAGQSWLVEAPLQRIPLFVKAGSVIPYRKEGGQIRKGTNDHLLVEIYTGDAGTFRLTEDDGRSRDYRRARAARTMFRYNEVAGQLRLTIGAVQSGYEGMCETRTYELRFKHTVDPQEVMVNEEVIHENGRENSGSDRTWTFDEESSTLIIFLTNQWKHERTEIAITP